MRNTRHGHETARVIYVQSSMRASVRPSPLNPALNRHLRSISEESGASRHSTVRTDATDEGSSSQSTITPRKARERELPTLDSVRDSVANGAAFRAVRDAKTLDNGVKVGISYAHTSTDNDRFLRKVAKSINQSLVIKPHLFAVLPELPPPKGLPTPLLLVSNQSSMIERAVMYLRPKFGPRLQEMHQEENIWQFVLEDHELTAYDNAAIMHTLLKAARSPDDVHTPPPGSRGIDRILADARARLERLEPLDAHAESIISDASTIFVDIRGDAERGMDPSSIPGAILIDRNALEWKFDPRSEDRLPVTDAFDLRVIIFDQTGNASSLAAASLQDLGLFNATDIIGGLDAWEAAGLPLVRDVENVEQSMSQTLSRI